MIEQEIASALELRWLNPPKHITLPSVCVLEWYGGGGCYYRPDDTKYTVGGHVISIERGGIVIGNQHHAATLAHEFRHHMQYYYGFENKHRVETKQCTVKLRDLGVVRPDWEGYLDYFWKNWDEFDALRYQHKKCPKDEITNYVWECIDKLQNHAKVTAKLIQVLGKPNFPDFIKRL